MSKHCCPNCTEKTQYQAFSGGKEWYCPSCEDTGQYPDDGVQYVRAQLLTTKDGQRELRRQMREELEKFRSKHG